MSGDRTLGDLGEFGLIERIERAVRRSGVPRHVVIGIGDDAAVVRPRPGEEIVVTTDSRVEDVHFRWSQQAPVVVGRRALAVSLSDLAAMGARPLGCVVALAAPADLPVRVADGLVKGLLREAVAHDCPLVGGNVSRGRETSLALTALGAVARGGALTRAGARPGHGIFVTGVLGASALELARAEAGEGRVRRVPEPRLAAGRALARIPGVGGCIDLSDGLEADLAHLLGPAGLGAALEVARLPRPPRFDSACRRLGIDPEALLLRGGDDYELLFTLPEAGPGETLLSRRLRVPVTRVGQVLPAGRSGTRSSPGGWRHF